MDGINRNIFGSASINFLTFWFIWVQPTSIVYLVPHVIVTFTAQPRCPVPWMVRLALCRTCFGILYEPSTFLILGNPLLSRINLDRNSQARDHLLLPRKSTQARYPQSWTPVDATGSLYKARAWQRDLGRSSTPLDGSAELAE